MSYQWILEFIEVNLKSLSGVIVIFGLAGWAGRLVIGKLVARETAKHAENLAILKRDFDKELEYLKNKLKKSDFIFQKEFEAASYFVSMFFGLFPLRRFPEMDWNDVCDEIAQNFVKIENELKIFLERYGAVLCRKVKEEIFCCIRLAGEGKFIVGGPDVSEEANQLANGLYIKICGVEELILKQIN